MGYCIEHVYIYNRVMTFSTNGASNKECLSDFCSQHITTTNAISYRGEHPYIHH